MDDYNYGDNELYMEIARTLGPVEESEEVSKLKERIAELEAQLRYSESRNKDYQ